MEKNELVKQKKSIDRKEVMENELTLIFAQLPKIGSDEKNAEVLYQFCRDINDWILGRYLREGNHFHVPFVNYTKDNTLYLDREKSQTPIDAKNLNHLYIGKRAVKSIDESGNVSFDKNNSGKIAREIQELREPDKNGISYLQQADVLDTAFATVKSSISNMLKAGYELDEKKGYRHEHVYFRAGSLVGQMNTDLDDMVGDEKSKRLYIAKRRDQMISFYNMMGPQRKHMFDEKIDSHGPYLEMNEKGKTYVFDTFKRLYNIYHEDEVFEPHKVFEKGDYYAKIKNLSPSEIDESMVVEMIQYLFSTHRSSKKETKEEKEYRNNLRNYRGTFADLFIGSMYLDNMVDQEELESFFNEFTSYIQDTLDFSGLETAHGVKLYYNFRKKEYFSQLLKLMRSADAMKMLDFVGGHIKYYPTPPKDDEMKLIKEFTRIVNSAYIDFCSEYWKSGPLSATFDSKGRLAMTDDEKLKFVQEVDPTGGLQPKKKKRKTVTGSNSNYIDAKSVYEFESKVMEGESLGAEFAIMPMINQNEVGAAAHHFLTKQKIVETFARDRSHFSISQYMDYFDIALKRQASYLKSRFTKINKMKDSPMKVDLLQQRNIDAQYPLSDGRYINLTKFETITSNNRELADSIALDQLHVEMHGDKSKIHLYMYENDVQVSDIRDKLKDIDLARNEVGIKRSLPSISRDYKGKILDKWYFVGSNYINAISSGHISSQAYIGFSRSEDGDGYVLRKVPYLARNGKKEKMTKEERNHAVDVSGTSKAKNGELYQVLSD